MQVDMQTVYNSSSLYALNENKINYKYAFVCEKFRIFYGEEKSNEYPKQRVYDFDATVPNYVIEMMTLLLKAKIVMLNILQLDDPLKKGRFAVQGARYIDVFIKHIPKQRGLVSSELIDNSKLFKEKELVGKSIKITLHRNLIEATATPFHELFHVFQYAYVNFNNPWFMEGLARWSQNLIQKREHKEEELPQTHEAMERVLLKAHDAEYFWRVLMDELGRPKELMRIFLENCKDESAFINSSINWTRKEKRLARNNKYILKALRKTIEGLSSPKSKRLSKFLLLINNVVNITEKDYNTEEIQNLLQVLAKTTNVALLKKDNYFYSYDYDIFTGTLYADELILKDLSSAELDAFEIVKYISGDLIISLHDIQSLNIFNNLKMIQGTLKIVNNNNLIVISGFNSLEKLKSISIVNNANLNEISGFKKLFKGIDKIEGHIKIELNKKLRSVSFLSGLKVVGSSLYLHKNSLENLIGLEKLETVGASLSVSNNQLSDISQLINLRKINGMLNLVNNNLSTLKGLENLRTVKTTVWNGKNITISIAYNKNLKDIEALKNIQTFDNYIILYFDYNNKYIRKPHIDSSFHKNILELYDLKSRTIIPTFKFIQKEKHDYSNFRKATHNKLLTYMIDFEVESDILVLSFVGLNGFLGGIFYNRYSSIIDNINTNKIFIHDKNNSWYHAGIQGHTNNMEETIQFVKKLVNVKKYKRVICFGASMGGYMSLLVGSVLKVDKIVAFAPQIFLDKTNRQIYGDNRWEKYLNKVSEKDIKKEYLDLNKLYQKTNHHSVDIDIHYANNLEHDCSQIEHFNIDHITKIGHEIDSHYVSIYLKNTKQLDNIVLEALEYDET